ncbi:hypothetical protein FRC00_007091 [Tulasnella sp. 408]|nr:hypothetical protein FRC00_007091 [Tulasnella sp. 408]
MTDPFEVSRDSDTSLAAHDTTPEVPTFALLPGDGSIPSALATLPDDILVAILGSLDIRDVIALRRVSLPGAWSYQALTGLVFQVSRGLDRATKLRSLWVLLAHREVLDRQLPWPSYALPLTIVPTKTIEEYVLRATKLGRQWAPGAESQLRPFSRCIVRPPNSIGWLRVVKGRWLILELIGKQLEVWDLQNGQGSEPVASCRGLKGIIDGSCITFGESSVTIILSTSSYVTNHLNINLPYLGDTMLPPNFTLLDNFEGYSGLLDVQAGLAVFSRSISDIRPLVRDMRTGSIVYFGSSDATQKPQRLLSARILQEYIVLIGPWTIEIYSIAKILSLMLYGDNHTPCKVAHASQSLGYPGGHMANHVTVLDPSTGPSYKKGESEVCVGIYVNWTAKWMRLHIRLGSNSDSSTFTSSVHPLFHTMEFRTIACCWGESGQRMLLAVCHRARIQVICGVAPSNPDLPYPDFDDHVAFKWDAAPDGEKDLFAGFAFDEATGICAVATSSGRIWIDDFSKPFSACWGSEDNLSWAEVRCGSVP